MEKLKSQLDTNKYIFKCSQCSKALDISDNNFFCKICKTNYCSSCINGHNEIFLDHKVIKANEELANNNSSAQNSLLANPDLDLDDRGLAESKHDGDNDDMYSDITMLFHETVTSLEEYYNEEICKLKAVNTKENNNKELNDNNKNENKIIFEKNKMPEFNIDELKKLEPFDRLKKIMEIINKK
jgi:hypothetical protein